jgi:hypothetical protein
MCKQPTLLLTTTVAVLCSATVYAQNALPSATEDSAPAPALPPPATGQPAAPYAPPAAPSPGYGYPPPGAYAPTPGPYAPPPGYYPPQPPSYYQTTPPEAQGPLPGEHTHDGFFLSLRPGIGILHAKYSYGGSDTTISGGGMALSFAVGGVIAPNLIIYGEVVSVQSSSTNIDPGYGSTGLGGKVGLFGIGPGIAYYLEPANFYVSGTIAFSQVTANDTGSSIESRDGNKLTDLGFGLALTVGKEWWVSHNWGLGVAGVVHVAPSLKMQNIDARMTAEGVSILFSATYN